MWRTRVLASLVVVGQLAQGCLIIPVPHQAAGSRGTIGEERARFLRAGETTREEVLLTLGEPEEVLDDERFFVYRWERALTTTVIIFFPYAPVGASGTVITARHRFRIEFDDRGLVKSVERSQ